MNEKPIIFSGEMVRAILDGRKTQTRRVIKQAYDGFTFADYICKAKESGYIAWWGNCFAENIAKQTVELYETGFECPYGKPGDLLWVRETWNNDWCDHPIYKADGGSAKEVGYASEPKWKSPRYMPKKVARIWLKAKDVRVERVQDISREDAIKEGLLPHMREYLSAVSPITRFKDLWDSINKKRGFGWDENPWVWVIEF